MSAIGAGVGKAVGAIGGPQVATVILLGGLVVGGLAGGVVGSGGLSAGNGSGAQSSNELSIYPCPDSGPAWATVGAGQKFLVTGKTADDAWVRIYWPLPDRDEAWIESGPLKFDGSLAALPVVPCAPVVGGPLAAVAPSPTLTPVEDNSPSPTPTAHVARNTAPALARLTAAPTTIAGGPQRYCANAARAVTFSVRATDADTVANVVLSYREPGASGFATKPMTKAPGGDTWQATLRTDTDAISGSGALRYFVTATDSNADPLTARLPGSGSGSIAVADCTNSGPTLASLKASPGTVHTNPGACQSGATTTTVSINATDVDTVTAATLFYKLPGDGSYRQKSMAKNGSTWSAKVTPVDQRPNADGKASYYVQSQDKTGKGAKSGTRTFTVNRCDYEATFYVNSVRPGPYTYCVGNPNYNSWVNLVWDFSVSDPDGVGNAVSKATISYKVVNQYYAAHPTLRKSKTVSVSSQRFSITSANIDGKSFLGTNVVTWTITTTDRFGGKSSATGKGTVNIQVC